MLLCFSNKISLSKVKNKTKIDILILHVGWEKRSEVTLDQKGTKNIQPIPAVVKWTFKYCFTVDDTLLNCKTKILIKNINLYKIIDKQQNNTASASDAVTY